MTIFCKNNFPTIVILILTCNQKDYTLRCLESLKEVNYSSFDILLVDNNSSDGTCDEVGRLFPCVKLIKTKRNSGCAGGRNIGIEYFLKETKADYLFFLDNDTEVEKNLLKELVDIAESDAQIGVVGAKVYYHSNPNRIWFAGGARINWFKGNFYDSGQGEIDQGQFDKRIEVDSVPGGFTFIKRKALEKAGKLDERYFIYFEDPDWCVRVKKAGFKIVFAPRGIIYHKASASLGMESPLFYYYRTRNRLLFMSKNATLSRRIVFTLYFGYDFLYRTIITLYLSKKKPQLKAAMIGVQDFIQRRFGERIIEL